MGQCTRGDGCRFIHDEDVKAEVDLKRALAEAEAVADDALADAEGNGMCGGAQ